MAYSGVKTQQDLDKVRAQYIANMEYQDKLAQANLDANLIFKKTGVVPEELGDTRTTQEKLRDILKLKQDLIKSLTKIMDFQDANKVVSEMSDDEVVFAAQQLGYIISDLSGKYKYGIQPPQFLAYLRKLIDKHVITGGVEMGLQHATGEQILLTNNQILNQMLSRADLADLEAKLDGLPKTNRHILWRVNQIKDDIEEMKTVIPTAADLDQISRMASNERADMMEALTDELRQLPSKRDLINYVGQLNDAVRNGTAADLAGIMAKLHNILDMDIRGVPVARALAAAAAPRAAAAATAGPAIIGAPAAATAFVKATHVPDNYAEYQILKIRNKKKFLQDMIKQRQLDVTKITSTSKVALKRDLGNLAGDDSQAQGEIVRIGETNIDELVKAFMTQAQEEAEVLENAKYVTPVKKAVTPAGTPAGNPLGATAGTPNAYGYGLSRPKSYVEKFKTKLDKPIERKMVSFTPFGNYAINKDKLEDGILMVRHRCGAGVAELPTQKISASLAKNIHYIATVGQLDYDGFADLNDDDKVLLYKLLKKSKMSDNISIPKVKKNQAEKDFDRFNTLKGSILAGNDSPLIAKELKLLIVKLMNNRDIPRREAIAVLIQLGALGI